MFEEHGGAIVSGILVLLVITGVVVFLARGIEDGQPMAYSVAILLWTAFVFAAGVGFTLTIQQVGENREARRARIEQERFRENTQENLALMGAVAKVQTEQARAQGIHTSMLQRQARDQQRLLAAGNNGTDEIEVTGFPFDEADFMDLED